MKKVLLICLCIECIICKNNYAQRTTEDRKKLDLEFYTGINLSRMEDFDAYEEPFTTTQRTSAPLGFQMSYFFIKNLGIKTGLILNPKGGAFAKPNYNTINLGTGGNSKNVEIFRLNYLDIPLSLTAKTNGENFVTFESGFTFGVLTKSEFRYNEFTGHLASSDEVYHVEDLENTNKIGYDCHLGINFHVTSDNSENIKYILGFRLSKGLSDIFELDMVNGINYQVKTDLYMFKFGILI